MTKATWFRVVVIALCACSGGSEPNQPGAHGALRITAQTSGSDLDPDGYSVSVAGVQAHSLAINADLVLTGLEPGTRSVALSGIAPNCSVTDEASRSVTIVAGDTTTVAFQVSCTTVPPSTGVVSISTSTAGPDPDPDGYTVAVDGGAPHAVAATGTVLLASQSPGSHSITLSGLATNCAATDGNPKTGQVAAGDTTTVTFAVSCVARTGAIRIEMATTGRDPDADGYLVSLDNQPGVSVQANGIVTVDGVHEGTHALAFTGFAENCDILPPQTLSASVAYADTMVVAVTARCLGTLTGRLVFSECFVGDAGGPTTCGLTSMNPDGSERERITLQNGNQDIRDIDVSPSEDEIVFIGIEPGQLPTAWIVDKFGKNMHALPGEALSARWSPDGSKLALQSEYPYSRIINRDGSNPVSLGYSYVSIASPSWSPDGTQLVVTVYSEDYGTSLAIMKADGTGYREIPGTGGAEAADWSPDGRTIVFSNGSNIALIHPDGSGFALLTTSGSNGFPRWSPDGQWIAYQRSVGGYYSVMVMDATGGQVRQVSPDGALDLHPAWGR